MICMNPISIRRKIIGKTNNAERVSVPCGKCASCLTNRRNDWVIRLTEEMKMHENAIFVTLTYSDNYLPYAIEPTLVKKDVQDFIKLTRYHCGKLRYYCVGEYGTNTLRPHYHLIIFGLSVQLSYDLTEFWKKGFVQFGTVNIKSISYVAKYHVNKGKWPNGSLPPFALMSLKPAIGLGYIDSKKNYHKDQLQNSFYSDKEKRLKLPRIYKERLYSKEQREIMAETFQNDAYSLKNMIEYYRKNPNGNFFQDINDRVKNYEHLYKQKSNFNNKL